MQATIRIDRLPIPVQEGDWHDKPLRWIVRGPGSETQKFSSKKDATLYKRIRSRALTQTEAINKFVAIA